MLRLLTRYLRREPMDSQSILGRVANDAFTDRDAARAMRDLAIKYIAQGIPMPPPLAGWVLQQLYQREPLVPYAEKGRPASRETDAKKCVFALRWVVERPKDAVDDITKQRLSVELHVSFKTIERWLYDPDVQSFLREYERAKSGPH